MKKTTKITQDNKQTRSTIPQKLVDKFKVTNKDSIEWNDTRGILRGKLIQENTENFPCVGKDNNAPAVRDEQK